MKQKTAIILYIVLFSTALLASAGILVATKFLTGQNKDTGSVETVTEYSDDQELLSCVEGTTTDMLYPQFWTDRIEDKQIFTPSEIEQINSDNPAFVEYTLEGETKKHKLFMDDLPETMDGKIIKALIGPDSVKDFQDKNPEFFVSGMPAKEGYLDEIYDNLALDNIGESVVPQYALIVKRTVSKIFPTEDFAAPTADERYIDSFVSAEEMPFDGVVILHTSKDGEFYYVLNGSYLGWVRKENLAICSSREDWSSFVSPEKYIVVTGSEIVLEETAVETMASGMVLPMGTRLRLSKDASETVNGRRTYGCYVVDIPARSQDGTMICEMELIPVSKYVHVGNLSMTSKVVLDQAFKFLGKVYGYGGALSSNDCSGFVRQVYACFGLKLPRNARAIAKMHDLGSVETAKMRLDAKKKLLSETIPGMPLYMDGHLMMYLGMVDEKFYVISSCATFIEPGHETSDIVDGYCVFVSSMDLLRANGKTWFEDISFILNKDY